MFCWIYMICPTLKSVKKLSADANPKWHVTWLTSDPYLDFDCLTYDVSDGFLYDYGYIVIVTLVWCFWQIPISYCKFLMSRPFKWVLSKDINKNAGKIIFMNSPVFSILSTSSNLFFQLFSKFLPIIQYLIMKTVRLRYFD